MARKQIEQAAAEDAQPASEPRRKKKKRSGEVVKMQANVAIEHVIKLDILATTRRISRSELLDEMIEEKTAHIVIQDRSRPKPELETAA